MAVLTMDEQTELRQSVARNSAVVTWNKAAANAANQAIEDWFEVNRSSLGLAIEAAAPGIFTGALKGKLIRNWLRQKFERGG